MTRVDLVQCTPVTRDHLDCSSMGWDDLVQCTPMIGADLVECTPGSGNEFFVTRKMGNGKW